jgi:hypothetical protein
MSPEVDPPGLPSAKEAAPGPSLLCRDGGNLAV